MLHLVARAALMRASTARCHVEVVASSRSASSSAIAVPGDTQLVAARLDGEALSVVAIDLASGCERVLARGEALFATAAGDVVLRAADDPRRLETVPLAGGPITTLATLPAPILDAADGPDGVHVELDRGGTEPHRKAWPGS